MERMTDIAEFLSTIGEEVTDADEESFVLFTQPIPSANNLGFVDSRALTVDVTIRGHEYCIHQSPTLLSSARAGGTTGAVLWKITPLFAEWISSPCNPLWTYNLLSPASVVAELGCGISALLALALAPAVQHHLATDQEYVHRLFRTNVETNAATASASVPSSTGKAKGSRAKGRSANKRQQQPQKQQKSSAVRNITFTPLDWELDQPNLLRNCIDLDSNRTDPTPHNEHDRKKDDDKENEKDQGFDLLLSCDCIYNEALISPFVRTCAEICRLRPGVTSFLEKPSPSRSARQPTVCIIAQQQRSPEVFEAWLRESLREFRVWRVRDEVLGERLKGGTGYLVHLLIVRDQSL